MSRGRDRPRAVIHPRDRDCESCGAAVGYPCRTRTGKELADVHCTVRIIGRWLESTSDSPDGEKHAQPAREDPGSETAGETPQPSVSPVEEAYPRQDPEARPAKTRLGNRRKRTAAENQPALF